MTEHPCTWRNCTKEFCDFNIPKTAPQEKHVEIAVDHLMSAHNKTKREAMQTVWVQIL